MLGKQRFRLDLAVSFRNSPQLWGQAAMTDTPNQSFSLKRQLEMARFERALTVAESVADKRALLTTVELARMNDMLTGRDPNQPSSDPNGPWRDEPVTLTLPSGKTETLALIADPKITARDRLHRATELAEGGAPVDAAVDIYVGLILSHVFKDANRRTAALAAHYFLRRYGVPLSGVAIHEMGVGDLREQGHLDSLYETVRQMAKFASRR